MDNLIEQLANYQMLNDLLCKISIRKNEVDTGKNLFK